MEKILEGIRVVEVADWVFVASAGTVMSDWGADIIKVEHPKFGDPLRGLVSSGLLPGAKGINFLVAQVSRNKRSIGIDLATDDGRAILYRLVEKADVFLTSFLPSARQKLRIDFADIRRINPKIVYAKGHGQGQKGPDADKGGYDACSFWARGSVADRLTPPGQPLIAQRAAFGDLSSGMFLAGGIAAALFRRERTGKAIEVDVSLLGAACWIMSPDIVAAMTYGFELPRLTTHDATRNPLTGNYTTKDQKLITLMMLQFERYWPLFAETIGRRDWLTDERFATPKKRREHFPTIVQEIAAEMRKRDRKEWEDLLRPTECIWAPVQSPLEIQHDPQVIENGYLLDYHDGAGNSTKVCASPVQFGGEGPTVRARAPEVGEHSEEVLLEAGYTWADIDRWKQAGVIS
jgi:crotonobetainyl-CoA:carnitine CoA-transferase CaiB-like acyl-CoA transferase